MHNFHTSNIQLLFGKNLCWGFFDSSNEVNVIYPIFAKGLELLTRPTSIRTEKIDSLMLDTYKMVVIVLSVTIKTNKIKFFEKTFLVANISAKVVLGMLFFILSNANIDLLD